MKLVWTLNLTKQTEINNNLNKYININNYLNNYLYKYININDYLYNYLNRFMYYIILTNNYLHQNHCHKRVKVKVTPSLLNLMCINDLYLSDTDHL